MFKKAFLLVVLIVCFLALGPAARAQMGKLIPENPELKDTEHLVVFELREGQERSVLCNPDTPVFVKYLNLEKELLSRVDYSIYSTKEPVQGFFFVLKPGQPHSIELGKTLERVWFKVNYGLVRFAVSR